MRVAGAEVVAMIPVAISPGNVAVSFDVLSYAGTLAVTLVRDPRPGAGVGVARRARGRRPDGIG